MRGDWNGVNLSKEIAGRGARGQSIPFSKEIAGRWPRGQSIPFGEKIAGRGTRGQSIPFSKEITGSRRVWAMPVAVALDSKSQLVGMSDLIGRKLDRVRKVRNGNADETGATGWKDN
jgi:hypothetical protein